MALSKLLVASLIVSLFLVQLAHADQNMVKTNGSGSIDCRTACWGRCSKALSSRWQLCMKACAAYCARCKCVPPATKMSAFVN